MTPTEDAHKYALDGTREYGYATRLVTVAAQRSILGVLQASVQWKARAIQSVQQHSAAA